MSIEQITEIPLFKFAFMLSFTKESLSKSTNTVGPVHDFEREFFTWANQTCKGQFMVFSAIREFSTARNPKGINVLFGSPSQHHLPVTTLEYPPSVVEISPTRIIAFENESDATAFKLKWN